jgi:class 3 adenylate cyclase/tetratricopeptide (TPR) repeat protein
MSEHRQLAAIMFTNIVGYSSLMESDEQLALGIIAKSRELQKEAIKKFNGEYIKEVGDQVIASFHSALKAVSCAVFIQRELNENQHLNLRIGIHIGDVILSGEDVFGDCVTIASKIENLTEANSICISQHVYNYIHNIPGIEVELLAENQLKELKSAVDVYRLSMASYPEELLDADADAGNNSIYRFLFWQELKRRKVIKVGSMYAATAFAILEAFDILFPAIIIPVWGITLIAALVIAGFVLTIYLTWVYDFAEDGLRKTEPMGTVTGQLKGREYSGFKKWLTPGNIIIAVLVIVIGILVYPKIFNTDKFKDIRNEDGRISIAVMPFKNLTGDTLYNVWQEGLQNLVISTLTNSKELSVRQLNTIHPIIGQDHEKNYASLTPSFAGDVALRLNTRTFILGNILKTGNKIRITAQLMNAESEEIYKTFQMNADNENELFAICDTLSNNIKEYFDIKVIIEEMGYPENYTLVDANSAEALGYYLKGMSSFINFNYPVAIEWYMKAIEIDTNFISAYFYISMAYHNMGQFTNSMALYDKAHEWFHIAYNKREGLPIIERLELAWFNAYYYETPHEQIKYIQQILQFEDQSVGYWYVLGLAYVEIDQYAKALEPLLKILEICESLDIQDHWVYTYTLLGGCYHNLNEHSKEKEIYEKGLAISPDHPDIILRQAICAISRGDKQESIKYLEDYKTVLKHEYQWEEPRILLSIGKIFSYAEKPDSAIGYFRIAHQLEPNNPEFMYYLGNHLIVNNTSVDEGLELINKALLIESDNYLYLDAKGWGLYQLGQYSEANKYLEKAWQERPHYDHDIYLHLQEVRKILSK